MNLVSVSICSRRTACAALALLFGLALAFALGTAVEAQSAAATVAGRVVNATPDTTGENGGGGAVAGAAVTLHMQTLETQDSVRTITDAQGRFRFEGIAVEPGVIYAVSVRYQDALYGEQVSLREGDPPPLTIRVYDAAYDLDAIRVGASSLLFAGADRATQTIAALEIVKVVNDSDYTFVPGNQGPMSLLRFGLPPGADGLQVDTRLLGADIVQVDRGFAVLGSVPPGTHDIMFTYRFPYEGGETEFSKSFPFGADSLRVLSPDEVLRISDADFGEAEAVSIGERAYQLIETAGVERGERVSVRLSGLPRTTLGDRVGGALASARYEYVAPVALGAFLAGLIPFAIWRRRRAAAQAVAVADAADAAADGQQGAG